MEIPLEWSHGIYPHLERINPNAVDEQIIRNKKSPTNPNRLLDGREKMNKPKPFLALLSQILGYIM